MTGEKYISLIMHDEIMSCYHGFSSYQFLFRLLVDVHFLRQRFSYVGYFIIRTCFYGRGVVCKRFLFKLVFLHKPITMADIVDSIIKAINGTNDSSPEPILEKIPATTEGMLIAYISLVVMAIVPIFLGSYRSVQLQIQNKVST